MSATYQHQPINPKSLGVDPIYNRFYFQCCLNRYQVGGGGAVSSTVASTKQSARIIQRRGSVLLARSDVGGRIDFGSPVRTGSTTSSATLEKHIEMASRVGLRKSSVRGGISSCSGVEADRGDRNLGGGSSTERTNVGLFSTTETSAVERVETEPPDVPIRPTGIVSPAPTRVGGSPSLWPLPAEERRPKIRFPSSDSNNSDSDGATIHEDPPAKTINLASEIPAQQARGGPATEVEVEGRGRNGEQPLSREEHRVDEGPRKSTVATRAGNMLAELPLSKLKIVIGKPSHIRQITLEII